MTLTCVTATFNCIKAGNRDKLLRCIESVAGLKIDHEHLVYDGASTDGTKELIVELGQHMPGLKVVSEPDTGIYNALNKGVRDAKGEWFYVLGSDDRIVSEGALQSALRRGAERASDVIATPVYATEDLKSVFGMSERHILRHIPFPHQGMLVRSAVMRMLNGFNEEYKLSADYDFVMRVIDKALKIDVNSDAAFAFYNDTGLSCKNKELSGKENLIIASRHLRLSEEEALQLSERNLLSLRRCLELMFFKAPIFRASIRYYLARWLANCLGLLRRDGSLIWH